MLHEVIQSPFGIALAVLLGLLVGSFLNVVIYRLPIMMERSEKQYAWEVLYGDDAINPNVPQERFNLLVPASCCPNCGHRIRAWENIPILSYLIQGKKCSGCRAPISSRYMWVEILTAVASGIAAWRFPDSAALGFALLFTWVLIALIFIDAEHSILPDILTLPLMWLGIIVAWQSEPFIDLHNSILGAVLGYLSLWSVYKVHKFFTGKEGMGYGDFKLLAALLAWQGVVMLPIILMVSSVCGIIYGIYSRIGIGKPMPFGPYLAVSGWITFLFGNYIAGILGLLPN